MHHKPETTQGAPVTYTSATAYNVTPLAGRYARFPYGSVAEARRHVSRLLHEGAPAPHAYTLPGGEEVLAWLGTDGETVEMIMHFETGVRIPELTPLTRPERRGTGTERLETNFRAPWDQGAEEMRSVGRVVMYPSDSGIHVVAAIMHLGTRDRDREEVWEITHLVYIPEDRDLAEARFYAEVRQFTANGWTAVA